MWNGFQSYLDANANDVTWAMTIATAFEEAGTDEGLSAVADSALGAALEAAGVALTRDGLTIEPAQVQGMPLTSGFSDDPVNVATGGFVEVEEDLAFTGGAASLGWSRCYNSTDRSDDDAPEAAAGASAAGGAGAFGPGWSSWCEARLSFGQEGEARWRHEDGRLSIFPRLGRGWDRADGESLWLTAVGASVAPAAAAAPSADAAPGEAPPAAAAQAESAPSAGTASSDQSGQSAAYEITDSSGGSWLFDGVGRPLAVRRGPGTGVRLTWAGARLTRLSHERGRWLELVWDETAGRVVRVGASDGRAVSYDYDAHGRLVGSRGGDDGGRPGGVLRSAWRGRCGVCRRPRRFLPPAARAGGEAFARRTDWLGLAPSGAGLYRLDCIVLWIAEGVRPVVQSVRSGPRPTRSRCRPARAAARLRR